MQPAIKMALRIGRQGADYLKAHFDRQELTDQGGPTPRQRLERVTDSIYASFTEQLQKSYKDHYIAPAGDIHAEGHDDSWHIFPVIGEEAFLRGTPDFLLALIQKKHNRVEHLLTINPVTTEEYAASRGQGAVLNSRRIRMNGARQMENATLTTNAMDHCRDGDNPLVWGELMTTMATTSQRVLTSPCPLLDIARISAGHMDGTVLYRPDALTREAGALLVQEAGGLCGDFSGNPLSEDSGQFAIANPKLFRELLQTLHPFRGRLPR